MILLNRKVIIVATLYLFLIVFGIIFGVKPLLAGVQDRQANLQIEYDKYRKTSTKLSQLNELSQSKTSIETAKMIANLAIPETLEQDRLILQLEKMVADLDLKLTALSTTPSTSTTAPASVNPAAVSSSKAVGGADTGSTLQATLGVSGSYSAIMALVDSLEKIDRVLALSSVTITAGDNESPDNLNATIILSAFGRSDKL